MGHLGGLWIEVPSPPAWGRPASSLTHLAHRSPAVVSAPAGDWQPPLCSLAGPGELLPAVAPHWPGTPACAAAPVPAAGPPHSALPAQPPLEEMELTQVST